MVLTELKPGSKGIITDLSSIDQSIQRRLLDLGVLEGREVCYKCGLPFGGLACLKSAGSASASAKKKRCGSTWSVYNAGRFIWKPQYRKNITL